MLCFALLCFALLTFALLSFALRVLLCCCLWHTWSGSHRAVACGTLGSGRHPREMIRWIGSYIFSLAKSGPLRSFAPAAMGSWNPMDPPQCGYPGCAMHATVDTDPEMLCGKHFRASTNPIWMKSKLLLLSHTRLSDFEQFVGRQGIVSTLIGQFILGDGASDHCFCGRCQPSWFQNHWICPADCLGQDIAERDLGYEDLGL